MFEIKACQSTDVGHASSAPRHLHDTNSDRELQPSKDEGVAKFVMRDGTAYVRRSDCMLDTFAPDPTGTANSALASNLSIGNSGHRCASELRLACGHRAACSHER